MNRAQPNHGRGGQGQTVLALGLLMGLGLGCGSRGPASAEEDSGESSAADPTSSVAPDSAGGSPDEPDPGPGPGASASAGASPDDDDAGESPAPEFEPKFDLGMVPEADLPGTDDNCDCKPNTDLIYLLDHAENRLWTYNPKDHSFKRLGDVSCPQAAGDTPFSLAVDRYANAWVQMSPSGKIYKVDTRNNNTCTDSGYTPGSVGPTQSGMAFSDRTDDGEECEQLYLHSSEGGPEDWREGAGIGKLGSFDPDTLQGGLVTTIDYNGGEMTGTQDGRLFAFAGKSKGTLIEYSPIDGSVVKKTELGDLVPTFAFAFAIWGGDFYFFTLATNQLPLYSKVTKLDYDGDGSLTTVVDEVPFMVVGAGVSVCAPLQPPQ